MLSIVTVSSFLFTIIILTSIKYFRIRFPMFCSLNHCLHTLNHQFQSWRPNARKHVDIAPPPARVAHQDQPVRPISLKRYVHWCFQLASISSTCELVCPIALAGGEEYFSQYLFYFVYFQSIVHQHHLSTANADSVSSDLWILHFWIRPMINLQLIIIIILFYLDKAKHEPFIQKFLSLTISTEYFMLF